MVREHININLYLQKWHGSGENCLSLMEKIEAMLKDLEQASAEQKSFLELKGLQRHLKLTEKAIEMANVWLKNIEIMINKRDEELF